MTSARRLTRISFALLFVFGLSACATPSLKFSDSLGAPGEDRTILLMPLDVELSTLRASGIAEPNATWTKAAKAHLDDALTEFLASRDAAFIKYNLDTVDEERSSIQSQVQKLYPAVGGSIFLHKGPAQQLYLPTKAETFDYTLGPGVRQLRKGQDARYGLFIHIRDSYATAGRIAVNLLIGGRRAAQVGYASLVDLETGDIVWFNYLLRATGDLREMDGARETLGVILTDFPK